MVSTVATGGTDFSANAYPSSIVRGPDGNLWFTEFDSPGRIGRITPAGVVTEFTGGITPGFSANSAPLAITAGPDGNLWFTEYSGRADRADHAGRGRHRVQPPGRSRARVDHTRAGRQPLVHRKQTGGIGRITPAGVITEFRAGSTPGFTVNRSPYGITTGADGNLWFIESDDPGRSCA